MKTILLNLIAAGLVIISFVSMAQPTLTATGINAVIGETYTYTSNTNSTISPGNAGANQTWDLSAMTGTPAGQTTVVTPSSTTYGSSFPNANVAMSTPSQGVTYYKTSSTALQNYGMTVSGVVIPFSNPEDFLHFPFSYNNTYTDTWAGQFQNVGSTFYRRGTTTVTADGYGTLITPIGTYTNVMRVHFVQDYQDSVYSGAPYIFTYYNDEYLWYKNGVHYQLAAVYTFTTSQSGTSHGSSYVSSSVGVEDVSGIIHSSSIFPNPATDKVTLNFTLTENKNVDIQLFNSIGQQEMISQNANCFQGENTLQLDVSILPEGIYFVKISLNGNVAATKRFLITK